MMKRKSKVATPVDVMHGLLDEAKNIVGGSRNKAYGDPRHNHACTAGLFSQYLTRKFGCEITITPRDVCFLNVLQKVSREAHWSQRDNALDIAGYAANAEACSI